MKRTCIETRGICCWRERLANPDTQWRRGYSALETAVSWESAADSPSGLPAPIEALFQKGDYANPVLMFAVAEHKVSLAGLGGQSQCDVWALLSTEAGLVSLSVEAKASEAFGDGNKPLRQWLGAGASKASPPNRQRRWECVQAHLPCHKTDGYSEVPFQLLHRCASAVIEAKRLKLKHAAFVVQAFKSPDRSFQEFSKLCCAMRIKAKRGEMQVTNVGEVCLGIGWADCDFATDRQVADMA